MAEIATRRTMILVGLYAVGLALWWWFATSIAPGIMESAFTGRDSGFVSRCVYWYADDRSFEDVKKIWKITTFAIPLALICHLALVVMVDVWHRRHAPSRTAGQAQVEIATSALLVVLGLAFFVLTVLSGIRHDYFFFGQIWEQILLKHDPWFMVQGQRRIYPLNAYGPLFTVFAPLTLISPLAPKLLFALAFWMFAAWLAKDFAPRRRLPAWAGLALVLWFANPYGWIEIALYGHFDILVGLLCIAAVECRMRERDYASAAWISAGTLLKYIPGVLVPFLMLDGRRIRVRFLATTVILGAAGMGLAYLIWGSSVFRPLTFAVAREPAYLSIFRFLTGTYAPLPRDFFVIFTLEELASPILLATLIWLWSWTRRRRFEMFASCVLAVMVTLLLYKVGFTQYPMVLFVLGAYWFVRDHETLRRRVQLVAAFCAYFAWIAYFDVLMVAQRLHEVMEWAGLVTFVLGGLLVASIVRAAPPAPESGGADAAPPAELGVAE
jgi:Glycosyltransferase family 87